MHPFPQKKKEKKRAQVGEWMIKHFPKILAGEEKATSTTICCCKWQHGFCWSALSQGGISHGNQGNPHTLLQLTKHEIFVAMSSSTLSVESIRGFTRVACTVHTLLPSLWNTRLPTCCPGYPANCVLALHCWWWLHLLWIDCVKWFPADPSSVHSEVEVTWPVRHHFAPGLSIIYQLIKS